MTNNKPNIAALIFFVIIFLSLTIQLFAVNDSEKNNIKSLNNIINDYEAEFYNTGKIDSSDFFICSQIYTQLIELYISLGNQYSEELFFQLAFAYLEKLKNLRLFDLFAENITTDSTGLKILKRNFHITSDYFRFKNELLFNQSDSDNIFIKIKKSKELSNRILDSVKISDSKLSFFLLMQKPADILYLQTECLSPNEAIVDYWIQRNKIIVFIVTPDTFIVNNWQFSAKKTEQQIIELTSMFYRNQNVLDLKFNHKLSYQLYQNLFQPIEKYFKHGQIIILIPDNFLNNFPFGLLVSDTSEIDTLKDNVLYKNCKEFDYLIHTFNYNYSLAAIYADVLKNDSKKKLGRKLLTMSEPVIKNNDKINNDETGYNLADDNSNYSADEIKRVSRLLWRHDNLKGSEVTKNYFFEKGRNYRWIYLALPGVLNNLAPLSSGILFSSDDKNEHANKIWFDCSEAMKSTLRTDMLTLSSCKLNPCFSKNNKGIVAFPQSFLFAGVRSVVHSQWSINSISTSQFMSKFYWELKYKRQTNAKALQEAKIASMHDTFKYADMEISRAHPYFWAGFRLIGSVKVVSPSNAPIPPWGVVIIVYIILITGAWIITKKTVIKDASL